MPIQRIQMRRGTTSEWATEDPVLASGEFGYDKTVKGVKIGDGSGAWSVLPWLIQESDFTWRRPEQYGAIGDGVNNDTLAVTTCLEAAAVDKGGNVIFGETYACQGEIKIGGGVTTWGTGGPQKTIPAQDEKGLVAFDSTFKVRWGQLNDGSGSRNDNPGPMMNLCIDGRGISNAGELLRVEAVETSMFNCQIKDGLADGVNWTQSQNVDCYNPLVHGFANGWCWRLQAGAAGLQPPGHIQVFGGHIGDSKGCVLSTSHDATFFVGPHDNSFHGTIFETGRAAGTIFGIIQHEDGDLTLHNCVLTIGAQVTSITNNATIVVRNTIRGGAAIPGSTVLAITGNCSLGGGAGAVKAAHLVRVEGGVGLVSNRVYYGGITRAANATAAVHCNDGGDCLVSIDGPVIMVTAIPAFFATINSGTITGALRDSIVPTRWTTPTGVGNPLQVRRVGDAANAFQVSDRGELRWLDPSSGATKAVAIVGSSGIAFTGQNTYQVAAFATGSRPLATAVANGTMIYDDTLDKPIWSNGSVWKDASGATV